MAPAARKLLPSALQKQTQCMPSNCYHQRALITASELRRALEAESGLSASRHLSGVTHAQRASLLNTTGLTAALELLKDVTDKHDGVSYADVFQLASATAIELAGGPKIPLRFGRRDARTEEDCCPEGNLPGDCCSPAGVPEQVV